MWSIIEPAIGITAGCLANIGSLIKSCPGSRSRVTYGTHPRRDKSNTKNSFQTVPRVATAVTRGGTPVPFDGLIHVTDEIDIRISTLAPVQPPDPEMLCTRGDMCV